MGNEPIPSLRYRMLGLAPIAVYCTYCKVSPGNDCRSRTGGYSIGWHKARLRLVGKHDEMEQLRMLLSVCENMETGLPPENIWTIRIQAIDRIIGA